MSKLKYVNMNETLNDHMNEITYGNGHGNGTESNKHDVHDNNIPYGSMYENYNMNENYYYINKSGNAIVNEYVNEIAHGNNNENLNEFLYEIVTVNEKMNNTENTNNEYDDVMNGIMSENNDKKIILLIIEIVIMIIIMLSVQLNRIILIIMLNLHSIIANEKRFPLNVIRNGLLKWYDIMKKKMMMMNDYDEMTITDSPYHEK